jgi:hypothetical protein
MDAIEFHHLGSGRCSQRSWINPRRYYGTTESSAVCEKQCREDPECTAYDFGYYVCSIYGSRRLLNPDPVFWGREWFLDVTAFVQQDVPIDCYEKQPYDWWTMSGAGPLIWPIVSAVLLVFVPLTWMIVRWRHLCCGRCTKLLNTASDPYDTGYADKVMTFKGETDADNLQELQDSPGKPAPQSPRYGANSVAQALPELEDSSGKKVPAVTFAEESALVESPGARDPRGEIQEPEQTQPALEETTNAGQPT